MLGEMVDLERNYLSSYKQIICNITLRKGKIMEDAFDLSMLNSIDSPIVRYYSWDGYDESKTVNNFREIFEKYSKRELKIFNLFGRKVLVQ